MCRPDRKMNKENENERDLELFIELFKGLEYPPQVLDPCNKVNNLIRLSLNQYPYMNLGQGLSSTAVELGRKLDSLKRLEIEPRYILVDSYFPLGRQVEKIDICYD